MSFANAIKAFEEKALLAANKSMCNAFEYLAIENVVLTGDINIRGYSDGDIANNWHVSIGATPVMVTPNGPDRSGSASLSRIKALASSMPFYRKDNTVCLTNVMGYSYRADKIGWPVEQSTNGWVWTGKAVAYNFTVRAINNLKGKYS
jgi:hypothetical protein